MLELYSPRNEGELLVLRSILDASDVHYFVKNDLFGSLAVGPQIEHYNRKTIYVSEADRDEACALLAEFLDRTHEELTERPPLRPWDLVRMILEFLLFGWFMPGRRDRRPAPPPDLRVLPGQATPSENAPEPFEPSRLRLVHGSRRRPADDE